MIKTHFKTSIRSIFKRKLYSAINIFGLSVGLAGFILIAMYVRHELSYDRFNDNYKQIYRVVRNEYTCSPPAMAQHLKNEIAEIENSSHFIRSTNLLASVGENYFTEDEYFWADNDFFKIFTVDMIQGDLGSVLKSNDDIIISESIAQKYFGSDDPMGKIISVSRKYNYKVAGVFKDYPGNSHYKFNVVLPVDRYYQISGSMKDSWRSNFTYTYVKLHKGVDMGLVNEKMVEIEKELTGWTPESGNPYEQYFFFQAISEIHLHSHRQQEVMVNGNIRNVYLFSTIAFLILIVAAINYVNLTTAIAGERTKEVGIRKVMGISKGQLIIQFLTESMIISFISVLAGLVIVALSLPLFEDLMERSIGLASSDIPLLLVLIVMLLLIIGIGTGILPSRSLSGVRAISIIRGYDKIKLGRSKGRDLLVLVQFMVALVLIILTFNVKRQLKFMVDTDPGYDKEQIINLKVFDKSMRSSMPLIKSEINNLNSVLAISTSYNLPNNITDFTRPDWFCQDVNDCIPISYNHVDYGFIDLYNIELSSGRNFSLDYPSDAGGAFILNEKAVEIADWESPIGMELTHYDGTKGVVVGIVKDFNFRSLHSDIAPLYLFLDEGIATNISIRISPGNIPATLESIKQLINEFSPGAPFHYTFFDQEFEQAYNNEKRLGSIFAFFAILAIILACLGLFGMSSFIISRRTKEMGVRKVFGSTGFETILLFLKNFLYPIILANIIAWPLALILTNRWLESFAYRVNISIWTFILAAVIVLAITLLTIISRSLSVSIQTPVKSLRYE